MARKRKRRQPHGSAWHWRQTNCWYATFPGAKKRVPLFDENGERIRGKESKEAAEVALGRLKLSSDGWLSAVPDEWVVARVCSEYIQYCERGLAKGTISKGHRDNTVLFLNDLCKYCGALSVTELKKGHIATWLESHEAWRSPATVRSIVGIVLAAFNRARDAYGVRNSLAGFKKPTAHPRLESLSQESEQAVYAASDEPFRDFLFALIHTGLRPFSELARLTADEVEESERGMMWRVYATKTKKIRKIPVRPEVADLARKLMKSAPRGSGVPLFRTSRGKPWKMMNGVARYLAIKKKLGWDKDPVKKKYSCYTCRHTFAHRMLSGYWTNGVGCSIETLAELIGDTPKVAFDHYGKEWGQHYQDPLWAAIGGGAQSKTGAGRAAGKSARRAQASQRRTSKPRSKK